MTQYVASKSFRCLAIWTVLCLLLHGVRPPPPSFELSSMNEVLRKTLPALNKLIVDYAPQTAGNCQYPPKGIDGVSVVPQPCLEFGILDKQIQDKFRITGEWMSGMKTVSFSDINITNTQKLAHVPNQPEVPAMVEKFELHIAGVYGEPKLFLHIEACPLNHTTLTATLGQGECKQFLDTADSLVETDRHFSVKLSAECHSGDNVLTKVKIEEMKMDTMTVRPRMFTRQMEVVIANTDITKMVEETVKANLMYFFTQGPLMRTSGQELDVVNFVNRLLRFNSPNQQFHCR